MPTYQCPVCGAKRVARPNWTRTLKCKGCGTEFPTDGNRVPDEPEEEESDGRQKRD